MTTEKDGPSVANVINGIEILDGMEVPDRQMRPSYPFGTLEPGQSFIVECDDKKHEASIRSMAVSRNRRAKDQGMEDRFIVRRIPGTETTVGVWRVDAGWEPIGGPWVGERPAGLPTVPTPAPKRPAEDSS